MPHSTINTPAPSLTDFIRAAGRHDREVYVGQEDHQLHTRRSFMSRIVERFRGDQATEQHREVADRFVHALQESIFQAPGEGAALPLTARLTQDQKQALVEQVAVLLEAQLDGRSRLKGTDIRAVLAAVQRSTQAFIVLNETVDIRDTAETFLSHLGDDPEDPSRKGVVGALLRAAESGQELGGLAMDKLDRESRWVGQCLEDLQNLLHAPGTRALRQQLVQDEAKARARDSEDLAEAYQIIRSTVDAGLLYLAELEGSLWLYQARLSNALSGNAYVEPEPVPQAPPAVVSTSSAQAGEQARADLDELLGKGDSVNVPTGSGAVATAPASQAEDQGVRADGFDLDDLDRDAVPHADPKTEELSVSSVQVHEIQGIMQGVSEVPEFQAALSFEGMPDNVSETSSVAEEPAPSPQKDRVDVMGRLFGDRDIQREGYERFLMRRDTLLADGNNCARALTDDQHFALHAYTMNEFSDMNRALRTAGGASSASTRVQNLIRSATEGLTALRAAGLGYRGFAVRGIHDYAALRNQAEGSIFTSEAFSSTSRLGSVGRDRFALADSPDTASSTVLHQFSDAGASVAAISEQELSSGMNGQRVEDEVLLPPGVEHRVLLNADVRYREGSSKEKVVTALVTEQANLPPETGRAGYFESMLDRNVAQDLATPDPRRVQDPRRVKDDVDLERLRRQAQLEPTAQASAAALRESLVHPENVTRLSEWTLQRGKPGGSNPGGVYKDAQGSEWLVKGNRMHEVGQVSLRENADRARNEVLASKLLQAAGVDVPEMQLIDLEGKHGEGLGVASRWVQGNLRPVDPSNESDARLMNEQFAAHAWLGNFDALGEDMANTLVQDNTRAVHVDPGGALLFRAQGLLKDGSRGVRHGLLNPAAPEWNSMQRITRGQKMVFGPHRWDEAKKLGAQKLAAVSNDTIRKLVAEFGPGEPRDRQLLAKNMIDRRDAVLRHAGLDAWNIGVRPERGTPKVNAQGLETFSQLKSTKPTTPEALAAEKANFMAL